MYIYKTVPAPTNIVAISEKDKEKAILSFGEIINRECADGWEYYSMEGITVSTNPGCFGILFGAKQSQTFFNMMIFRKEK